MAAVALAQHGVRCCDLRLQGRQVLYLGHDAVPQFVILKGFARVALGRQRCLPSGLPLLSRRWHQAGVIPSLSDTSFGFWFLDAWRRVSPPYPPILRRCNVPCAEWSRGSSRSTGRWGAPAAPRRGEQRRKRRGWYEIELRPNFFTRRWNHFPDFRVENQLFLPLQLPPPLHPSAQLWVPPWVRRLAQIWHGGMYSELRWLSFFTF